MPVIATASLLPFKGIIITDGLLQVSDVIVGPNYTSGFKDVYMTAKQEKKIIKSLYTEVEKGLRQSVSILVYDSEI